MATSCYGGSEPPNPKPLSLEEEQELCLYFDQVRVKMDKAEDVKYKAPPNTFSGSSSNASPTETHQPCNSSPTKTQQAQPDVCPSFETGFVNLPSVPVPLYSQTMWRDHSFDVGGHCVGSNSLKGYDNGHQPINRLGATTFAPSLYNWTNQMNPFGNNWCQRSGGHDRVGIYSNSDMGNLSSLNSDGFVGDQSFKLPSYDIAQLAMTQPGSELILQSMAAFKDPLAIEMVFKGVLDSLFDVMSDSHGHCVFRKLVESCTYNQLKHIVAKMTFSTQGLVNISVGKYGSKSIQRLIKVLDKSPLIHVLTLTLSLVLEQLMTNRTGSFVILKCLNDLDTEKNKEIYEAAERSCLILAQNEKGCIYLNEFITYSKTPYREKLMDQISSKSKFLSQDPSGNFVVQHVLGLHNPVFSEKICFELRNLYIQLSSQKGGSHVVEKCLNSSGMHIVVSAFLKYDKLWQIARDQFGNYVMQTALKATKRANSPLYQMLLEKLSQHQNELMFGYGRKVMGLIDRGVPLD